MTAQMIVRVDPELKNHVQRLAKAEGRTVSDVVRGLMEDYVRDRDIALYIDDLWGRIGEELTAQGAGPGDIRKAIEDVRSRKR
jgi:predicted DNA-binding protein